MRSRKKKERGETRIADGEPKIKQKFAGRNKIRSRLSDLQCCVATRRKREAKKLYCTWIEKTETHTHFYKKKRIKKKELKRNATATDCNAADNVYYVSVDYHRFQILASSRIEFG